jgi:hypothetical protein
MKLKSLFMHVKQIRQPELSQMVGDLLIQQGDKKKKKKKLGQVVFSSPVLLKTANS